MHRGPEEVEGGAQGIEYPDKERVEPTDPRSRIVEWLLLTGNRWYVVAGVLLGLLVLSAVLSSVGLVAVTDGDSVTRSFAALIGGNFTLLTIVIAMNQLILSREFGTPAEQQSQIEEMQAYRREAEDAANASVGPVTPGEFLVFLVQAVREHALAFRESVDDAETGDPHLRRAVDRYTETVLGQVHRTVETSHDPPTEAFHTLVVILKTDFTRDLQAARWFRTVHGDSLPSESAETLDELIRLTEYIGALRQYLETLYLQRELALLSRRLLYLGFPAVLLPLLTIWVYGQQSGATLQGTALMALVVSAVAAFAPLSIFFAYVVRIATITRETAGLMPFESSEPQDS